MSDLIAIKDLVNPFKELQNKVNELKIQQQTLLSPILHHCFKITHDNPYIKPTYIQVIAVDLVRNKVLIESFQQVVEISVQSSAKKRMEFTIEEMDINFFMENSENVNEINPNAYYLLKVYDMQNCDIYYDTKGFSFKCNYVSSPDWIW